MKPPELRPAEKRRCALAVVTFAAVSWIPYSSLTLVGAPVAAAMVLRDRAGMTTGGRAGMLAAASAFVGCALYTLGTDLVHLLFGINLQARESARINELFHLGLSLDPDRMPALFLGFDWVWAALFYACVAGGLAMVMGRDRTGGNRARELASPVGMSEDSG